MPEPIQIPAVPTQPEVPKPTPPKHTAVTEGAKPVNEHGFPENTSPDAMETDAQRAAYWKYMSRSNEQKFKDTSAQAKADADAAKRWREYEEAQKTPSEQAITKAREEAKAEARREVATDAVQAIMTAALADRGRSPEQVQAIISAINPQALLSADGSVDHAAITGYLDVVAPKNESQPQRWPDLGQGQQQGAPATGMDAGRAAYEAEKARRSGKQN